MQQSVQLDESFYLDRLTGQVNSIAKTSNEIKANTNTNVVMNQNTFLILQYALLREQ